jgi:hypothetical protein
VIEKIPKYIPPEEEMKKAEDMMVDEEREKSEIRARHWEQEDFLYADSKDIIDENIERRKLSETEKEKLKETLIGVGKLFKDSGLKWMLDGAMNISLMNGEFIGMHNDIDISFEEKELRKLDAHLIKKGYGLFLRRFDQAAKRPILRRVSADDLDPSMRGYMGIIAIDEDGKIKLDRTPTFIDVHIIDRNSEGAAVGRSRTVLPEKWLEPLAIEYNSEKLNLSHPAAIVYYKLYQGREYDLKDLKILVETGKLTKEDVNEVEEVLKKDFEHIKQRGIKTFTKIAEKIKPGMTRDEIINVLSEHPLFRERVSWQRELIMKFVEKILENEDRTGKGLFDLSSNVFEMNKRMERVLKNIDQVRQWVIEARNKTKK